MSQAIPVQLDSQDIDARLASLLLDEPSRNAAPFRVREFRSLCERAGIEPVYRDALMAVFVRLLVEQDIERHLDKLAELRRKTLPARWEI